MSAPVATTRSALAKRRLAGVAFLTVLVSLVWLSTLLYQKAFTPVVNVTLEADRIGNQLSEQADVKLRGIVVGRVTGVDATATGATVDLALDPDRRIPRDVTAQLIPKTLFGEKYVALQLPAGSGTEGPRLREGDVIPQDRSSTALETEKVLDDLLPLLRSLEPQQLSTTLNALSTALRGRGDRLGASVARAGAYFGKINPSVPQIGADLQGLADFADNVHRASPDLLEALDNLSASSRNIVEEEAELQAFLVSTKGFASTARAIVAENEQRFVSLAEDSTPSLQVLARYAPEFPCFLGGLAQYDPIVTKTFGGGQPGLHITLEATRDSGGYAPGDEPEYKDDRGPRCWGLPRPEGQEGDDEFDDGYRTDPDTSAGINSPALALVAAPVLGTSPAQVPDAVTLLLGPLAGGHAVGLS